LVPRREWELTEATELKRGFAAKEGRGLSKTGFVAGRLNGEKAAWGNP